MTAQERIDAAIATRDKATPGPWDVVFIKDSSFGYVIYGDTGDIGRLISHSRGRDLRLIAAAPDLVDEVVRLRKWQEEVLPYLNLASARLEPSHLDFIRFNDAIDDINRLIADAQEDKK